jgi:hypothetical protein
MTAIRRSPPGRAFTPRHGIILIVCNSRHVHRSRRAVEGPGGRSWESPGRSDCRVSSMMSLSRPGLPRGIAPATKRRCQEDHRWAIGCRRDQCISTRAPPTADRLTAWASMRWPTEPSQSQNSIIIDPETRMTVHELSLYFLVI